jgi:hypothetical protein
VFPVGESNFGRQNGVVSDQAPSQLGQYKVAMHPVLRVEVSPKKPDSYDGQKSNHSRPSESTYDGLEISAGSTARSSPDFKRL